MKMISVFKNYIRNKIVNLVISHPKFINRITELSMAPEVNLSLTDQSDKIKKIEKSLTKNLYDLDPCFNFYGKYGHAISTSNLTIAEKQAIFVNFQHKEKAKVALSVATSYSGGHYLEIGSHDLYTLRNFLAAFDVGNLDNLYPDTNFYAFDIFGSYDEKRWNELVKDNKQHTKAYSEGYSVKSYFDTFTPQGDILSDYKDILNDFDLFTDRVHLIKGFFEDTIPKFKLDGKVGFVCIDCNILESYQVVYHYILDIVQLGTYIYVDEYFCMYSITKVTDDFNKKLIEKYKLKMKFIRSAGSVGALFRIVET